MKKKRNEPDVVPWSISTAGDGLGSSSYNDTADDGPGTTCDDNADLRKRAPRVGSTEVASGANGHPPSSGVDVVLDMPADQEESCGDDHEYNPYATFIWDPLETRVASVESTVGFEGSSLLERAASARGAVAGFEIISELGRGGMGIVYKARHLRLKRLVALKVIRPDHDGSPEGLTRFEIEAEVVARLDHPNIVGIYEIGRAGGAPFVALELVEGGTLKDRLAGTPQPVRDAAALLSMLARAIHAAHLAGILHRDLKPSNVLFSREGVPKIADFGLAKRLDVEEGATLTGQVIGTPSYMAPEQAQGWTPELGHAVDIYSLGAILYEMLTGRPPIKGESQAETLRLVVEEDPVSPSSLRPKIPFDLETICLKCIARDPRQRYASALLLAEDLDRFLNDEPILARRTPLWERGKKLVQRHPVITTALATLLVATVVAIGAVLRANQLEERRIRGVERSGEQRIFEAHAALVRGRWDEVGRITSELRGRIEKETDGRFAKLRTMAQSLDEKARRGSIDQKAAETAQARMGEFRKHRDEAGFRDTRFVPLVPADAVDATCREARAGLAVFGTPGADDLWTLAPLPRELSASDQDEVASGFYELLLILADAVAQPGGATSAEQALRIIDRAPAVLPEPTRAFHLRRATYLAMKGDRPGAARENELAERVAPSCALDFFLIGRELARKSDWKAAITSFEAAAGQQPNHFWAQCLLAICHLQNLEPQEAWLGFNSCLDKKPECVWLYLLRGMASTSEAKRARNIARILPEQSAALSATASEKLKTAEKDYRTALELLGGFKASGNPLQYVLLVNRAHIRIERKDLGGAAADLQAAIGLDCQRFEAYGGLASVFERQGKTPEALDQLSRAIELKPGLAALYRARADLLLGLESASPDLHDIVLRDWEHELRNLSADQRASAFRDLRVAIRRELPKNVGMIAIDESKRAALLHVAGRHAEALERCDAALGSAPRLAFAHQLRIHVLLDLKRYDDLIRSCDVALSSIKPSAELYELRGMAKDGLEDYAGAIEDYTASLLSHPTEKARVLCRRGWSYLLSEALAPAGHDFAEAIRLAPEDADAYSGRALAGARLGQHEGAVSDAERSRDLAGKNWRIAYNAACVYALAARAVDSESRRTGPPARRVVRDYLDRALDLMGVALELAPAEKRQTIQSDPVLEPIRRWRRSL